MHVHLSASPDTAATVGARRGRPVVLGIDAAAMSAGGHQFFQAANGVWLTSHVPVAFISYAERPAPD
jgi:putative RNA 2'-phosphotransferase